MSAINKNRTPWILVVTSMILLFLFVGYWNVSSYLKEKEKLAEDVEIQLQLAFTEVKDSELIYFIKTHFSDEEEGSGILDSISIFLDTPPTIPSRGWGFQSKMIKESDSRFSEIDSTIVFDFEFDPTSGSHSNHTSKGKELTVIASSNVNSIQIENFENDSNDSNQVDVQIKQVNIQRKPKLSKKEFRLLTDTNFANSWIYINDSIPRRFDSLSTYEGDSLMNPFRFFDSKLNGAVTGVDKTYALFKTKLIDQELPHDFSIIKDPSEEIEGMKVTYVTNGFGFTEWSIDLKKYQLFILQKMIPTLLFSLFLLGIISLAFWTLLNNWIKQNRLVLLKNEFINNMTHELKTPIATVGVALEAISNFDLETEQVKTKEYVDISRNEISRLSLLVDKVLNIASFDSEESTLKSESVDMNATIEHIIQSMKLQLEDKNAQIQLDNNASTTRIVGDPLHLGNVVHNIIDNALKYSTTNPQIDIAINENNNHLIITFTDDGQGIPKEYQTKIFDRFFRVPKDDQHDVKGHGLGLNYVQHIIQAHNGKITVESTENQGTTFTIVLPKSDSNV